MAVEILEAAAVHEAVILLLARLAAAGGERLVGDLVDASRLSAEMQISTSLVACASAIFFGVNWANLSWVSSITWMVSEKHHAGGGLVGELRIVDRADRLIEGLGGGEIGDRQVHENQLRHLVLSFESGVVCESGFDADARILL